MTDVGEAQRFVEETGVDTLAISVGIVHGVVPGMKPHPLDIARTEAIRNATRIPLVLHGASGIPEDQVRAARLAGVHKFNADTDLRHAFRAGIEAVWVAGRPPAGRRDGRRAQADDRRDHRQDAALRLRRQGTGTGGGARPWR